MAIPKSTDLRTVEERIAALERRVAEQERELVEAQGANMAMGALVERITQRLARLDAKLNLPDPEMQNCPRDGRRLNNGRCVCGYNRSAAEPSRV